jgi:hypothetical protein
MTIAVIFSASTPGGAMNAVALAGRKLYDAATCLQRGPTLEGNAIY